jgi:hypothetical protein
MKSAFAAALTPCRRRPRTRVPADKKRKKRMKKRGRKKTEKNVALHLQAGR